MSTEPSALRLAFTGPVVKRGLLFAVVVGPILVAINHGDSLLAGQLDARRSLKIGLTFLVPYLVSTVSSVAASRQGDRRSRSPRSVP